MTTKFTDVGGKRMRAKKQAPGRTISALELKQALVVIKSMYEQSSRRDQRINSMMMDLMERTADMGILADSQPNIRRMIACHILAGLVPTVSDRISLNVTSKEALAKDALQYADALIAADREDRRVSRIMGQPYKRRVIANRDEVSYE